MGFLDDLICTIREAAEEAQGRQAPSRPAPRPRRDGEEEEDPADADRGHAHGTAEQRARSQAQVRAKLEARRRQLEAIAAAEAREAKADAAEKPHLRPAASIAATISYARGPATTPTRLSQLLHSPTALREAMILKEVLDRPLALRRGRRR